MWSHFEFIQNKRRNKLTVARADALVTILGNMQLMRHAANIAAKEEADPTIPWLWYETQEEPEQPEADEPEDSSELADEAELLED